jgi:hypothetical protein
MQSHTQKMRLAGRARYAPGKHAKPAAQPDPAGKAAHRIVVTALLGTLAVGSAAAASYGTAAGHASTNHQVAAAPTSSSVPWMY